MKNWKPFVKYNDKFLDAISWFMKVGGISLFPFIILREKYRDCLLYTSPSPRDNRVSRMPSSA